MDAKEYYSEKGIGQLFNSLLTGLLFHRPEDPIKYLQECLQTIGSSPNSVQWDLFVARKARSPLPPIESGKTISNVAEKQMRESPIVDAPKPLPPIGQSETPASIGSKMPLEGEFSSREIVFLMGGPGLSKSLLGENLASRWPGFVHISMGGLVRNYISKLGTAGDRWQMAESLITRGEIHPDVTESRKGKDRMNIAIDLLIEKLRHHSDARGFILDGYPRTIDQMDEYGQLIDQISLAILIDAEQNTLQQNLLRRGHQSTNSQNVAAAAARQIAFFKMETLPVCKFLDDRSLLRVVDGERTQNEIFHDLKEIMAEHYGAPTDNSDDLATPHPPAGPRPSSSRGRSSGGQIPVIPDTEVTEIRDLVPDVPDVERKEDLPRCPLILLMGGPGSGRSEQATAICARYPGFRHISIQDVAKRYVLDKGHAEQTWDMMATLVQMGEMETDSVTADMVVSEIKKFDGDDVHAILLEGYPRSAQQLNDFNLHIGRADLVLLLDSTEFYMTVRLLARGEESGRVDDNLSAIARRLTFFKDETLPVVKHYDQIGRLVVIHGDRDSSEVFYDVCCLIDATFYRQVGKGTAVKDDPSEDQESVTEEVIEPQKATLLYEDEEVEERGKKEGNTIKQCKVVFVTGGPGSGKGTQCEKILNDFDVGHVSTGDLIRAEVETGSERAKELKEVMEKGELVSLDVVLELLREHLTKNASQHKGFLVDGFPRELEQATRFEKEVVESVCMLYMDASEEEMKSRILERAKTSGRADDNEETIAKRIETFKENNDAIVKYFEEKGKLVKIDCNSSDVDAIYATVKEALEKNGVEVKGAENANGTAAAAATTPEGDAAPAEEVKAPKEEEEKKEEEAATEAETKEEAGEAKKEEEEAAPTEEAKE